MAEEEARNPFTAVQVGEHEFNISHETEGDFPGNPVTEFEVANTVLELLGLGRFREASLLSEAMLVAIRGEDPEQETEDE